MIKIRKLLAKGHLIPPIEKIRIGKLLDSIHLKPLEVIRIKKLLAKDHPMTTNIAKKVKVPELQAHQGRTNMAKKVKEKMLPITRDPF